MSGSKFWKFAFMIVHTNLKITVPAGRYTKKKKEKEGET